MWDKLQAIEDRYNELGQLMADPQVFVDHNRVTELAREHSELEEVVDLYREYQINRDELAGARALLEEDDPEIRDLAQTEVLRLEEKLDALERKLRLMLLPKDPRDGRNVIVEIRAGAGGDEAGLFSADLFRMYTRYAERQGWSTEILSENETGIGGFKEVVFEIRGKGAYSRLKYESGVHRVQRIPATESAGRVHTSTATVAVLPEVDEVEVTIDPKDLEFEAYGSSGPGGQHMQKNATAIRLLHKPTGLIVSCESERSQTQNKLRAVAVLRARLYERECLKQEQAVAAARRSQVGTGERSEKIRTYNFPQNRITDHRIGFTLYRLSEVLYGDLDPFIEEMISKEEAHQLEALAEG
ncbi:MAG: peptide chain release factor 1 [Anaerolineae bacterium]|nr:peptide chain release factor 1 [Anaerolineae bacterium]